MEELNATRYLGAARFGFTIPWTAVIVASASAAMILVMLVHLLFLDRTPIVFTDEPWNANAAWNLLNNGINFDTMHTGTLDQFGYEWIRMPFLGDIPMSLSFAGLGLGLFQARLPSWFFGVLLLFLTTMVGRRIYGIVPGVVAALLLCISLPFSNASHIARPDIMLATVVMTAYWLALIGIEDGKGWANLSAGILLGVSLDVHQNSILFAPGLALLYLASFRYGFLKRRETWLCALGGLLGIAYYVGLRILPSPSAYSSLFGIFFSVTHVMPIKAFMQTFDPMTLVRSLDDEFGRYHFYEQSLHFGLVGASAAFLLSRRSSAARNLLIFLGTGLVMFVLFVGNKSSYYGILFYPFFMLMVGTAMTSLLNASTGLEPRRIFAAAMLVLVLIHSVGYLFKFTMENRYYDYNKIANRLATVIPPGARVMGSPNWWFGLANTEYRSTFNLSFYHYFNGHTLMEGLNIIRPEYIIVDARLRDVELADIEDFSTDHGFSIYKFPRGEFERLLHTHGRIVLEFTDQWHGDFEVYAIDWEAESATLAGEHSSTR